MYSDAWMLVVLFQIAYGISSLLLIGWGLYVLVTGTVAAYGMRELTPRTARALGFTAVSTGFVMMMSCCWFGHLMDVIGFYPDK